MVFIKRVTALRVLCAILVIVGSAVLVSSPTPIFTSADKAYYLDEKSADFIRPGLVMKVTEAQIAADGTVTAKIKLTDPKGLPLDREGILTPGTISTSVLIATIPNGKTQYVSYTTRVQTSPITKVSATQAGADSGGTWAKIGDGLYSYTFRTKVPTASYEKNATHSIAIWGSRNLTEFELGTQYDDDIFHFVPDGSAVKVTRDVIKTETCNKCHDALGLHGGSRRSMEVCATCHTPQTIDPDTGNTVDMPVMIHKIHAGANLPSVEAGGKYTIIGNAQSVHDYSNIHFPTDLRNCKVCHEDGAAQDKAWLTPNRAACGGCHDNVNFATGENHVNLPQLNDNRCSSCHVPQGELEFDVSVLGAHTVPRFSKDLPGVVAEIVKVDDGVAGKKPVVTFTLKDKAGKALDATKFGNLSLILAGPTTDYATYVREDARRATGSTDGTYVYTFTKAIPEDAKGTFSMGIEGYQTITLMPGTKKELAQRDAMINKVVNFSVDGSRLAPRREIVSLEKCNACHYNLSLHGDNRNRIESCVLCHNPNETDAAVRPASEMPAETIDMRHMIHRIHTGAENDPDRPYVVYGRGSTRYNFSEVHYPGDRRNCTACHVNGTEQLPMRAVLPVKNARGLLNPLPPTTAACTGCHTADYVASHALINTSAIGESCATCHGRNAEFSVNKAHAR